MLFEYLFHSPTHRWLDEHIIGLNSDESRGYQAMGVLHYIGLRDKHKGIFQGVLISEAIEHLRRSDGSNFSLVISSLERTLGNSSKNVNNDVGPGTDEFEEGKEKLRLHKIRERDQQLIIDAKKRFKKKYGQLFCEVCGYKFEKVYGERGKDFIEGHHKKPVHEMKEGDTTKVEDIGMLCSNCHRMIHRHPMISMEELKRSLKGNFYNFDRIGFFCKLDERNRR